MAFTVFNRAIRLTDLSVNLLSIIIFFQGIYIAILQPIFFLKNLNGNSVFHYFPSRGQPSLFFMHRTRLSVKIKSVIIFMNFRLTDSPFKYGNLFIIFWFKIIKSIFNHATLYLDYWYYFYFEVTINNF